MTIAVAYQLESSSQGLTLCHPELGISFRVDFTQGRLSQRQQTANRRNELIAKAVGLPGHPSLRILDATAGWGRDAFILASLGCVVTMIEASPTIAALLQDGLDRAKQHPALRPIIARLSLQVSDSVKWMQDLSEDARFDVVYLDPMYPARTKSARVKKDMQILQQLAVPTMDEHALFEAACRCAKTRVVVKRPLYASAFANQPPDFSWQGSHHRFDGYRLDK